MIYNEYKQKYFAIKEKIEIKRELESKLDILRNARNEQKMHFDKVMAVFTNIEKLKSTILWQEKVIKSLEEQINENLDSDNVKLLKKDKELELKKLEASNHKQMLTYYKESLNTAGLNEKVKIYEEFKYKYLNHAPDKDQYDKRTNLSQKASDIEQEIAHLVEELEKEDCVAEIDDEAEKNKENLYNGNPTHKIIKLTENADLNFNMKLSQRYHQLSNNYLTAEIQKYKEKISYLENKIKTKSGY